jgi:selenocysteine lyase/cysteine desulfurase
MLQNQSQLFNLPQDITYLNCSYMSPMLKTVAEVGVKGIYGKEDPTVIKPEDFFDNTSSLREEFAKLINAPASHCAIAPSVSYGMANVAKNLKAGKGDNIVVADEQFPSNVYAWMALREERGVEIKFIAPPKRKEDRGKVWNEQILEAIDKNTKLVATGHVHWADGTLFDLEAIRAKTKDVGALMVIDGTQSIGALPFDVKIFQPDAVVAAGYKWMMGPYSTAMAYYGDYFSDGRPVENNWMNRLHSEDFANLVNYQEQYQPGMVRYEVGESANFILTPMLTKAIEQVNAWGPENIQQYTRALAAPYLDQLRAAGFWIEDEKHRAHHLLGLRLPGHMDLDEVKKKLQQEKIFVSVRGNSIRVSPHLYNATEHFEHLMEVLGVQVTA